MTTTMTSIDSSTNFSNLNNNNAETMNLGTSWSMDSLLSSVASMNDESLSSSWKKDNNQGTSAAAAEDDEMVVVELLLRAQARRRRREKRQAFLKAVGEDYISYHAALAAAT